MDILNRSLNSNVTGNVEVQSSVDNVRVTKFEVISPSRVSIDLNILEREWHPLKVEAGAINLHPYSVEELSILRYSYSDFNQVLAANSINSSTLINETLDIRGDTF